MAVRKGKVTTGSPIEAMLPVQPTVASLGEAAQGCTACNLYRNATQAVFGEGSAEALVMMVGEQPGDQEDLQGRPFVGPAGQLLDAVMKEAGLLRSEVYITNAVKHFKWEPRGQRRLHQKPAYGEIKACRPWLDAEMRLVKPRVVVCLGASAAQSFMGSSFRITQHRGKFIEMEGIPHWMATLHPSGVLRMPDEEARRRARADLTADLAQVRELLDQEGAREQRAAGSTG